MTISDSWGTLPIINAAGYGTRVGGSCPAPEVLDAMRWAQENYFEIDDLLARASQVIARETGAAAGVVTCGASAALTLGAAAILAGKDTAVMEALPDVSGLTRTEFLYPTVGRYDYDHPLRASGAQLVEFDFKISDWETRLRAAIGERTAGVVFVWTHCGDMPLIARIAQVCRRAQTPFLLDAAMGLPPAENLKALIQTGANLVALSGGKHLGGPQNSGLLFGDENFILSAWLQMVDMDVRPESWSFLEAGPGGFAAAPPRHGIGRGAKVGKDAVVGCITALERYAGRDFVAERKRWEEICRDIAAGMSVPEDFHLEYFPESPTEQFPVLRLQSNSAEKMTVLKRRLKEELPKIILTENEDEAAIAYIYPMCLTDADLEPLKRRVSEAMNSPL